MTKQDLATQFIHAGLGNEEINLPDLKCINVDISESDFCDWEEFCSLVYFKLTGKKIICTLRGRGFRSQYFGRAVSDAILNLG